jgi:hypothetical protein
MKQLVSTTMGALLASAVLLASNPATAQENTVQTDAPFKDAMQIRFDKLEVDMPLHLVLTLMRNVPVRIDHIVHLNFDAQHLVWEGENSIFRVLLLDGHMVSKEQQNKTLTG